MRPLAPLPDATAPPRGLWAGALELDPVTAGARQGRVRRWMYAAAGDGERAVGAAIVDLGFVGTAFVWAVLDGEVVTWERVRPLARGCGVGTTARAGAAAAARGRRRVELTGDGGLAIDVAAGRDGRRLVASLRAGPVTPASLVTATPAGGWNATVKAAGYDVAGELGWADDVTPFAGGGWRDWTSGRQDRHTTWRWAAGAGRAADRRRVGLNVSTGMNAAGAGEDVVWWDGVPYPLDVTELAPLGGDPAGRWVVAGDGWRLELDPVGVRAADEDLLVVVSRYVQPVGTFTGTLPGPDGAPVEVSLAGVTEDHEARW